MSSRIVGQLSGCSVPVQPKMATVLVGQHHVQNICFSHVPMHFFLDMTAFVGVGVGGPLVKSTDKGDVDDSRFFTKFAAHGRFVPRIAGFDMALWKVPVALRVLEQKHGAEVDQDHAAGGLHGGSIREVLMAFPAATAR